MKMGYGVGAIFLLLIQVLRKNTLNSEEPTSSEQAVLFMYLTHHFVCLGVFLLMRDGDLPGTFVFRHRKSQEVDG